MVKTYPSGILLMLQKSEQQLFLLSSSHGIALHIFPAENTISILRLSFIKDHYYLERINFITMLSW